LIRLWRICVVLLAKLFKLPLCEMLSTLGVLMASGHVYGEVKCNIMLDLSLEGELTAEQYQFAFLEFEERASKEGLVYPELKQGLTSWMGYWFFQNDAGFDVKNHIKEYSHVVKERCTEEDVNEIKEELINAGKLDERETDVGDIRYKQLLPDDCKFYSSYGNNCQIPSHFGRRSVPFA
jgi:hypothetical protein